MGIIIKKYLSPYIEENTYIVTDEATGASAVIDPGILNKEIVDYLADKGIDYILLTHAHGDHIKDIMKYKAKYPDASVAVGCNEKDFLEDSSKNGSVNMPFGPISLKADILTDNSTELSLGESVISFISTPGHTPGSQCIRICDSLFSGDTLFFMSVGATHFPGGDWEQLKKSISETLFALPDEVTVYPGHGPETLIGYEKRANPFV